MKSDSKKGKIVLDGSVAIEELPDVEVMPEVPAPDVEPKKSAKKKKTTQPETELTEAIATPDPAPSQETDPETIESTHEVTEVATHSKWKLNKRASVIAGSAFLATVFIWAISAMLLSKTTIGTTTLSSVTGTKQLTATIEKQAKEYRLSINDPDGKTKQFSLQDMGLTVDTGASVTATQKAQNNPSKRLIWWKPISAQYVFKQKTESLDQFITKEIDVSVQPSKDASISIENGTIKLNDSVSGIHYSIDNPKEVITQATQNLQPGSITLQRLTKNPDLSVELLKPYKESLEKTLNQPVSFIIGDKTVTPTTAQIASWMDITPNIEKKKIDIAVNSGKVVEYINKMAANAIRPARSQVIVKKADGSEEVVVAGVRGLDVLNKSDVATTISKTLLDNKGINVTLPVSYQPYKTISTGYYEKWIEADITNKRLYAHEYTNTVKTILVSAGAPATPTVTGQFTIGTKLVSQDMRGANVDGSSYFQPRVPYVSYFYGSYAIHGNYWRPLSYFGNINSSHGCIGMTPANAQWIYDWAPKGTPVIVYK